jgi:hypothetical protein
MKKNFWCAVFALMVILCFVFFFVFLQLTQFREIPLSTVPELVIVNAEQGNFVLVKFVDHPPWSHSRFFTAEYDYNNNKITLKEYYMVYHPFSQSINTNCIIVLNNLNGEYMVCTKTKKLGRLLINDNKIEWYACPKD